MTSENLSYSHRNSLIHNRRQYQVRTDGLAWQDDDGPETFVPYSEIKSIRLQYAPSRVQANRYVMTLQTANKGKIDITNTTYKGIGDFEEQNETYVPFVHHLHEQISKQASNVLFRKGSSWSGYLFSIVVALFTVAVVITAGLYFVFSGLLVVALVKTLLLIYFMPRLWRYIKRNKPSRYDPLDLPADSIPELA